jgi:hypothetical protein
MPAKKQKKPATTKRSSAPTTKTERQQDPLLPTVEWLAEVAALLWPTQPKSKTFRHGGIDYAWVEAAERALAAYKAAQHVLHFARLESVFKAETEEIAAQLASELSVEENEDGRIDYHKACKLITSEGRKDRAEDRFTKLLYWLYSENYWFDPETGENEEPPHYEKRKWLAIGEIAQLKRQYMKMEKIPKKTLVQALSQFGFYTRQQVKKTGQEVDES